MIDLNKTKSELIAELKTLRKKISNYQSASNSKHSLKLYKNILQSTHIVIAIYNNKANCIEANDTMATIIGATKEQVLKQNYHQIEY